MSLKSSCVACYSVAESVLLWMVQMLWVCVYSRFSLVWLSGWAQVSAGPHGWCSWVLCELIWCTCTCRCTMYVHTAVSWVICVPVSTVFSSIHPLLHSFHNYAVVPMLCVVLILMIACLCQDVHMHVNCTCNQALVVWFTRAQFYPCAPATSIIRTSWDQAKTYSYSKVQIVEVTY